MNDSEAGRIDGRVSLASVSSVILIKVRKRRDFHWDAMGMGIFGSIHGNDGNERE